MYTQFIIFSIVGAIGTAAHFAVLITLVHFELANPVLASATGCVVGALVNYILNYSITFKSQNPHNTTLLKFFSVALVGLCLNSLIMAIAIQWMHYLLSQVLATSLILLWNFICSRYWTFKEM
jgi:putative flippase GtrA